MASWSTRGSLVAIPGFVQTHVHLCQTLFRGLADDLELLDWLRTRIFPFEHAHSSSSMYASARIGLAELIRSGTTTIMDMGSIHYEEEVIRAVDESGIRAFVGKAMMDINETFSPLARIDGRCACLHCASGRSVASCLGRPDPVCGRPAFRPLLYGCPAERSACDHPLSSRSSLPYACSRKPAEMESVRKRCGMGNVEFFEQIGILDARSCLAHCIWLSDREMDLLASRQAKVLHCPSSNLKLGSGIARVPEMLQQAEFRSPSVRMARRATTRWTCSRKCAMRR